VVKIVFKPRKKIASSRRKIYKWNLKTICKVIIDILQNKFDCFIIIEGKRGLGKSTLAYQILRRVSTYIRRDEKIENKQYLFRPKRDLLFTQNDVLDALNKRWHDSFICDEMINVTFNRDFFSDKQKKIVKALNMNRDHCNLIVACVPQFSTLDNQIKNLCRIKITVIKRGLAILQLPNKTIYGKDIWDAQLNEKIERQWLSQSRKPKYSRLTTFRGFLRFFDLQERQRKIYEQIKFEKRNLILNEEEKIKEETEKTNPTDNIFTMLKRGVFKNMHDFDKACVSLNLKPTTIEGRVKKRLRNEGSPTAFSIYFSDKSLEERAKLNKGVPMVLTKGVKRKRFD